MISAMPSKPLRFLYRKYASNAPQGPNGIGLQYKYGDLLSHQHFVSQSGSLGQLHQLGRELTEVERVQMYFALSEGAGACSSQTYSSVGSASTNGRSIKSKKEQRPSFSPSRYRSKSQEFQSKYRLALSRSSPDNKISSTSHNPSSVTQLPFLQQNNNLVRENTSVNEISEKNTPTLKQENRTTFFTTHLSNESAANLRTGNSMRLHSASNTNSSPTNLHVLLPHAPCVSPDDSDKFPRCNTRSTIDADRIDSSQYQYLLDDFSNFSSSTSLCSVKSDPASSHFSARAQRPSTTATSRATHRLRDLQTCTTNGTPRSRSRQHSLNRSPDHQWPPRYAIIPSWPSYEDIQTLNSCGEHRGLLTQIYWRESRRVREKNQKMNLWNSNGRYQPIHVVPSHTNTECAMCNLYSHQADPTLCPPNSPMVIGHDCQDEQSRLSTSHSLHVNRSSTNHSFTNASSKNHSLLNSAMSAPRKFTPSGENTNMISLSTKLDLRPESNQTRPQERLSAHSLQAGETAKSQVKRIPFHRPSKNDVSYSWDTYKFAYVKAKG